MTGALKATRALAPVALVGLLCGHAAATKTIPGSPPRIAPPCSPDGTCTPRYETWGWYETRWRPFPGDVVAGPPTEADTGAGTDEDAVGGVQLPNPQQEGSIGPAPRPGGATEGATPDTGAAPVPDTIEGLDGVPAPTLEPGPGIVPAPGVVPPAGSEPAPGGEAAPDPLDPFGAAPPTLPNSLQQPPVRSASAAPRAAASKPVGSQAPAPRGRNLEGDDAPPSLPPSLQGSLGRRQAARPAPNAGAATLQLPARIRPQALPAVDNRVVPASALAPLGIQLINPAAAVAVESGEEGLQQAIYIEASDLPAEAPAAAAAN